MTDRTDGAACPACNAVRNEGRFCSQCGARYTDAPNDPLTDEAGDPEGGDWLRLVDPPLVPGPSSDATPDAAAPATAPEPAPIGAIAPDAADGGDGEDGDFAYAEVDDIAAPRARISGMWIGVVLIAALAIAGVAWKAFSDIRPTAELAPDGEAGSGGEPAAWQQGYTDDVLPGNAVTMVTNASARRRDFPSTQGTQILGELPFATEVTGQWVRGRDGTSRWLRLPDGGYVWEGNLAEPGGEGSPIAIPFSNSDSSFGEEIGAYLAQARATFDRNSARIAARIAALPEDERDAMYQRLEQREAYQRVPNRRFAGLTITGVGQSHESHKIIFKESLPRVMMAFRANGLKIDDDGKIPLFKNFGGCSFGIIPEAQVEGRRLGASYLYCWV